MKKCFCFLLTFFCLTGIKAQSWGHPGSTWTYEYMMGIAGIGGIVDYKLTNVFTAGTKTCQTISGVFTGTHVQVSGFTPTVIPNWKTYTTCKSNDVIYFGNDTVVNFNATIGDKWLRLDQGSPSCNSRKAHVVLDTGHKTINGFNLRYVAVQYTNTVMYFSTTFTINNIDTIVERICLSRVSGNGNDMLPFYCEVDNVIADYPQVFFRCYKDSAFLPNNGKPGGCGLITGLGEEPESNIISVYPQPVNNELNVRIDATEGGMPVSFSVYNIYGQFMFEKAADRKGNVCSLSVNDLQAGIYFLNVITQHKNETVIKFIKE